MKVWKLFLTLNNDRSTHYSSGGNSINENQTDAPLHNRLKLYEIDVFISSKVNSLAQANELSVRRGSPWVKVKVKNLPMLQWKLLLGDY